MTSKATITVLGDPEEVQRQWRASDHGSILSENEEAVTFKRAPGDRGTEIHVDLARTAPGGALGETLQKLLGAAPRAKVMDELRRFKQVFETGVVTRSEGSPEGELAERKLKQRPAQPMEDSELMKVGLR
ncbi:MAG: cyclase/dehydrase [Conexibacter sp.]|jgi:uncharacterized membrane protein|nr:cyclase/dehydrase [Conexibacter sp.]MCZ4492457.1 cyclase/dehydrase [Conexibacter sp.]MDX6732140.1 hypothetical protein [Baekduia sp.]